MMRSLLRIFAFLRKEFLQLSRDRLTFGMIVGIPMIQLLMFGFAINTDVRNLAVAYVDEADTHLSRQLVADMGASKVIELAQRVASVVELMPMLDVGQISIGILLPHDFDRRVQQSEREVAQLLVDGTDLTILSVARQLTAIPVCFDSQRPLQEAGSRIAVRYFYNPERRSAVNIVSGLVGVILTMTIVLFTAVAIMREKERSNMELLINTPVRTSEFMLGKIIPYILIGLIQLVIVFTLGWFFFQVPIRGSESQVLMAVLFFIADNLSLGLLFSTLAGTQFQAMQMTFFFFLPSILLSGFMFPFDGMPAVAQNIAELLPLTHFNRLIRGIVLRWAYIMSMWDELMALVIFMTIALSLAILIFRKRLD